MEEEGEEEEISGRPPGSPSRRASVPPRQPRGKAGRRGFCFVAEWEKQPSVSKRLMGNAILVVDQSHTGATYRQRCMGGDRCTEGSTYPARPRDPCPRNARASHIRVRHASSAADRGALAMGERRSGESTRRQHGLEATVARTQELRDYPSGPAPSGPLCSTRDGTCGETRISRSPGSGHHGGCRQSVCRASPISLMFSGRSNGSA